MSWGGEHLSDGKYDILDREAMLFGHPTLMERVGGYFLSTVLILFLIFAAVFKTPEKISLPVVISSSPDAGLGVAPRPGRIEALLAGEGDGVAEGDLIAVLASPADFQQVLNLKDWLVNSSPQELAIDIPLFQHLGPLQARYERLRKAAASYGRAYAPKPHEQARAALQSEQRRLEVVHGLLVDTGVVAKEKLAGLSEEANIRRGLLAKGVGSRLAVQAIENQILDQKSLIIANKRELEENAIAISRLAKQFADLKLSYRQAIETADMGLAEAYTLLLAEIGTWERENLLHASVGGRLLSFGDWSDQRFVVEGERLFIVMPDQQHLYATGALEGAGGGQARIGDRVLVALDDYPSHRFGKHAGEVETLSAVVVEGKRYVRVALGAGQEQARDGRILYREGMTGVAEIVTAPQSLLSRLWNSFRPEDT